MTNILGLKQNRWIVGAVLLLTTCNLQAQEQPNAREKFERGNWFVSGGLNGEWLTKTIGNVYAGGKISGGVYLTPLSGHSPCGLSVYLTKLQSDSFSFCLSCIVVS